MINAAGSSAPDGRTAHGAGDFGEGTAFATPAGQRSQRSGISRQPLADPGGDSPFLAPGSHACHSYVLHQIGRAHVRTPVTNAHLVCRHLLEKKKPNK